MRQIDADEVFALLHRTQEKLAALVEGEREIAALHIEVKVRTNSTFNQILLHNWTRGFRRTSAKAQIARV